MLGSCKNNNYSFSIKVTTRAEVDAAKSDACSRLVCAAAFPVQRDIALGSTMHSLGEK